MRLAAEAPTTIQVNIDITMVDCLQKISIRLTFADDLRNVLLLNSASCKIIRVTHHNLLFIITDCPNCVDDQQMPNRWTMPLTKLGEKRYYLGVFFKVKYFASSSVFIIYFKWILFTWIASLIVASGHTHYYFITYNMRYRPVTFREKIKVLVIV